jgi:hypothetical protein
MSNRRSFMAFVGGAAFTGAFQRAATVEKPTLLLPASATILPPSADVKRSLALLTQQDSRMMAIIRVGQGVPRDRFDDWLEVGLQMAEYDKARGDVVGLPT